MEKEFIEIMKDYIQDTRVNTGVEYKFDLLVNVLIESTRLNYNKTGLKIDDDGAVLLLLKAIAPKEYNYKFNELYEEEIQIKDEEIPF